MTRLPDDRIQPWPENATAEIGDYVFDSVRRNVKGEPCGGAYWEADDEQVAIRQWQDGTWSVEAIPIDREGDHLRYIEYQGAAEHNLARDRAFTLAIAYMRGETDLEHPSTVALINQAASEQTAADEQAGLERWSA